MDVWAAVQTDLLMRLPARRVALSHARSSNAGVSTFTTQFDWPAKGGEWARGAFHAIDLPFTFYTLGRAGWLDFLGVDDPAPAMELAARHMDAWGSFARTGSPGWPSYTPDGGPTLIFDTADRLADDPLAPAAAMWDDLWSAGGGTPA